MHVARPNLPKYTCKFGRRVASGKFQWTSARLRFDVTRKDHQLEWNETKQKQLSEEVLSQKIIRLNSHLASTTI